MNDTTQAAPQVEAPSLAAYYYGFAPTGIDAIDLILAAVAAAGQSFHHTEGWAEPIYDGPSAADRIQSAAQAAADAIRSESAELAHLREERAEMLDHLRAAGVNLVTVANTIERLGSTETADAVRRMAEQMLPVTKRAERFRQSKWRI